MTDERLARSVMTLADLETAARAAFGAADPAEHEQAVSVVRQAIGLRRLLERWITMRACKAQTTR
jgi:hypothetical protein